jgi:hypothetical protein
VRGAAARSDDKQAAAALRDLGQRIRDLLPPAAA